MEGGIREHSSPFTLRKSSGCVPGGRLTQTELNQEKGGNGDAVTHRKPEGFLPEFSHLLSAQSIALCPLTVCVVGCSWLFPYFGGFNRYCCDDVIQGILSWLCRQRNFCGQSESSVASEVKPGISMLNFRSHPGNPKFRDRPPPGKAKRRRLLHPSWATSAIFHSSCEMSGERCDWRRCWALFIFTGRFHGFSFTEKTRRRQYL